ncbi:MAG: HD domain-containing protein [Treponema sp.]|nr:HD domain-containing protein [Treponema sp.]
MVTYYTVLFSISLILVAAYAVVWHKHYDLFLSLIFCFVPIANLGYLLEEKALSIPEVLIAIKITYIGGSYLILFIMFAIFNMCDLKLKKPLRFTLLIITTVIFLPVLTIGKGTYFYKDIQGTVVDGRLELSKIYGMGHTLYYVMLVTYVIISCAVILYSQKKKRDVSTRTIKYLLVGELTTVFIFFVVKIFKLNLDLTPLGYIIDEIFILVIASRLHLYDVTDTVIDTISLNEEIGFINLDKKFNYLGSNSLSKKIFPALEEVRIDQNVSKNESLNKEIVSKIQRFIKDNSKDTFLKKYGEKVYQVNIDYLYNGKYKRGYMLFIQDDTQDQKYIKLMENFNSKLQDEVAQKTEHIIRMHDNLILSIASMVESRDNSTGGHIKRTSEGVHILMTEIMKGNEFNISKEFCKDIIKAAPMHDLGKIAVDDAILRKPGRFTPEEYEKMKIHAEEGARIVREILKETDDATFRKIAENIAHYHHERWDGSGYPCGLKGEEIPLEARIMAIADVYDALVSKRVYKEKMSFKQADKIIMEGMGKQFDKRLEKYYTAARPKLEAYYKSLE